MSEGYICCSEIELAIDEARRERDELEASKELYEALDNARR